jgi:hypothetical protein
MTMPCDGAVMPPFGGRNSAVHSRGLLPAGIFNSIINYLCKVWKRRWLEENSGGDAKNVSIEVLYAAMDLLNV